SASRSIDTVTYLHDSAGGLRAVCVGISRRGHQSRPPGSTDRFTALDSPEGFSERRLARSVISRNPDPPFSSRTRLQFSGSRLASAQIGCQCEDGGAHCVQRSVIRDAEVSLPTPLPAGKFRGQVDNQLVPDFRVLLSFVTTMIQAPHFQRCRRIGLIDHTYSVA